VGANSLLWGSAVDIGLGQCKSLDHLYYGDGWQGRKRQALFVASMLIGSHPMRGFNDFANTAYVEDEVTWYQDSAITAILETSCI